MFDAKIITATDVDFDSLLLVAKQALGRNPAAAVDRSGRKVGKFEKYLSILASIVDETAQPGMYPQLLGFMDVTVQIGIENRNVTDFLQYSSGMRFVWAATNGFADYVILKGDLGQWRDAIVAGTNDPDAFIQMCYCKLVALFESAGARIWPDYHQIKTPTHFRLEHRP